MLQNNPVLKSKIDQLWDKFWSGGIVNPLTAIEQITCLLFMKRLDDLDLKQQADADFTGDAFTSRFADVWVPPEHREKSKKDIPSIEGSFTPKAKKIWEAIAGDIQIKILNNVWCVHCRKGSSMGNLSGKIESGMLVLRGTCTKCGGDVARIVENE